MPADEVAARVVGGTLAFCLAGAEVGEEPVSVFSNSTVSDM